jgi:hypothetical protein
MNSHIRRMCLIAFRMLCCSKVFSLVFLLAVVSLGSGCMASGGYTRVGKTGSSIAMPAPGKSKVVFIRPNPLYRDFQFYVYDAEKLIGILPYKSCFQYECEPGPHRFVGTMEKELKVMEANLLPGKIYYAKLAARYGMSAPGVNMYSLYPGCPGELWEQMPAILVDLAETSVNAEGQAQAQEQAPWFQKKLQEFRPSPEAEVIRPEHGQSEPIRAR